MLDVTSGHSAESYGDDGNPPIEHLASAATVTGCSRNAYCWEADAVTTLENVVQAPRTEGFNGKPKLVIRRAYGSKTFRNYRLRLLNACA